MTKAEEIRYNNLKSKLENALAKIDMIEQEKAVMEKEKADMEKENKNLKDENEKIQEEARKNYDKLYDEIAEINKEVSNLKDKKKEDKKTIEKLEKQIETLKATIEDLKGSKIKDSSNSSKPSSTNGFKKVIQNNRIKTGRNKGGQKGREGKTLKVVEKVDQVKDVYGEERCDCGGEIIYEVSYIRKQLIDIENELKTIEYRYHKGICNKCGKEYIANIPKEQANPVQYSKKVKTIIPIIRNVSNMSIETTREVFSQIFKGLPISTGWIHKQDEIVAKECEPVVEKIKEYLRLVNIAHADETGVKIDDYLGTCISFSDKKAVVYGMFKNKSKESFDEFDIFQKYKGILVHDHNKTYYMYVAMQHGECNVHICRYLQYYIELFEREGAKKLKEFLLGIYKEKLEEIAKGNTRLREERIKEIEKEYLRLLDEWEKEYNEAISCIKKKSKSLKEEENLFKRLREYKEEHLRFIKNFEVPFSNNEAERNLRSIKIKLNISKRFGKIECAKNFAIIKTIIETAKKQNKNIVEVFNEILNGNHDVFDLKVS